MAETTTPPKYSKKRIFLIMSAYLFFLAAVLVLTLLSLDVFYLPYLSPFAHFLAKIISPFVPLLAPLMLGVFLKVCQHKTWPRKKSWVFITASWIFQQVDRVRKNAFSLYKGRNEHGCVQMCGLNECHNAYLEEALIVLVILAQWRGWKWEFGYIDMWLENLVANDLKNEAEKKRKEREASGIVEEEDIGMIDEKVAAVVDLGMGGDAEKQGLLVDVEEKKDEKN